MNRRILLFVVLLVLGGIAWWLSSNSGPTTLDRPLSDFAVPDTSRVSRIFIADRKGLSRASSNRKNGTFMRERTAASTSLR